MAAAAAAATDGAVDRRPGRGRVRRHRRGAAPAVQAPDGRFAACGVQGFHAPPAPL